MAVRSQARVAYFEVLMTFEKQVKRGYSSVPFSIFILNHWTLETNQGYTWSYKKNYIQNLKKLDNFPLV